MPEIEIAPTLERAKQSLGIRHTKRGFAMVQPIEWLYERAVLGQKHTVEAQERLEAGRYFTFLFVIAEERPNRAAMLDWTRFLGGGGSTTTPDAAEDYQTWILDKKREYIELRRDLVTHGYFGKAGHDMIMNICGTGMKLKQIEEDNGWAKNMAGHIMRTALDDLRRLGDL